MIAFPNCKINLGLRVVRKRLDGYHDLETAFYPMPLQDVLEIIETPNGEARLISYGIPTGSAEDNLCLKAYELLRGDFPQLPPVHIYLYKAIPIGAGLGGGSADASFTLKLLNKKFNLNIPDIRLFEYALQLGSDCPFFLLNQPALATGRGEILIQFPLSLKGYQIWLCHPGIHISTADLFQKIKPVIPKKPMEEILNKPVKQWQGHLKNDFEEIVMDMHPEVRHIKEKMLQHGALYASMTGTGSTVYGIFSSPAERIHFPEAFNYWAGL